MNIIRGCINIMRLMAEIPADFNSAFAFWNFLISYSSLTKLFTTRILVKFSCTAELRVSIFFCMLEKREKPLPIINTCISNTMGMVTTKIKANLAWMMMAMIRPPTSIPGARRHMRNKILMKFWICVTSLVRRVTREPVENLSIFSKENFCTLV